MNICCEPGWGKLIQDIPTSLKFSGNAPENGWLESMMIRLPSFWGQRKRPIFRGEMAGFGSRRVNLQYFFGGLGVGRFQFVDPWQMFVGFNA